MHAWATVCAISFSTSPLVQLYLRGTCSNTNTDSTTLFYSLTLTFLIETLISLSIHNIFDGEALFDGK